MDIDPRYNVIQGLFEYSNDYFQYLSYVIIFSIIIIIYIVYRIFLKINKRRISRLDSIAFLLILCMSLLGYTIGYISGNSRNPIMDIVITSVLTLFSSILTLFISKGLWIRTKIIVIAFAFMIITLIYGINCGSQNRVKVDNAERYYNDIIKYEMQKEIEYLYQESISTLVTNEKE